MIILQIIFFGWIAAGIAAAYVLRIGEIVAKGQSKGLTFDVLITMIIGGPISLVMMLKALRYNLAYRRKNKGRDGGYTG